MIRTGLKHTIFLSVVLAVLATRASFGVVEYTETFSTNSANWRISDTITPMTWVSGGGPSGPSDAYVSATNISFVGAVTGQLRTVARGHDAYNSSADAFVGNWRTSGVAQFSVSLRHNVGVPVKVGVRFASSMNFPGAVAESPVLVESGEWVTLVVPIATNNEGFVSFEGSSFTNVFANIGNVQVLLYVPDGFAGEAGPFTLDVDNPGVRFAGATSDEVVMNSPSYDRWMYPFNGSSPPGNRPLASSWGTFDDSMGQFDQRDAQVYFAFALTNLIETGYGPDAYEIVSMRFRATASDGNFVYDPTADSWRTYLNPTSSHYEADLDSGHPVELFGAGFRGGFTAWSFGEDGLFAPTGSVGYKDVRSVYPLGYREGVAVDVSNNINPDGTGTNGFNPVTFAVGTASLAPGEAVPLSTTFTFDINTGEPRIQKYLQSALNDGILGFVLTSLHAASFMGPSTFPVWDQNESVVGTPASLEISYSLKPSLGIVVSDDLVKTVLWPLSATNYLLEASADLINPNWTPLTSIVSTNDQSFEAILPPGGDAWYLRLQHP